MAFKTDLEIELQKNCNLARWKDLGKINESDFDTYELAWNDFKRMLYVPLRESQKLSTSDEALHIANVVKSDCGCIGDDEWCVECADDKLERSEDFD